MHFDVLALVVAVSLLGSALARWRAVTVPLPVAQIALGLLLGVTGLGVLDAEDAIFSFMAHIGFALVMFVAGTHVPVSDPALRSGLGRVVGRLVLIALVSAGVGAGLAAWLAPGLAPLFTVVLASSSAALVLPLLAGPEAGRGRREREEAARRPDRAVTELVAQVAIADALAIILLPMAVAPAEVLSALRGVSAVVAAAVAVWVFLRWAERTGRRRRVHVVSERAGLAVELKVLLIFLFALCAVATATGVSVMLAGFALGLAVAAVGQPKRVARQMFALTEGFFGPVFYVWFGASLDLRALAGDREMLLLGVLLGLGAVLAHAAGALLRQPLSLAVLSAGQMGVPVAAVTVAHRYGVLEPGADGAILLGMVVVVAVVSPVLRRRGRRQPESTTG